MAIPTLSQAHDVAITAILGAMTTPLQRWVLDQTEVLEAIAAERRQEAEEDFRREYDDRQLAEMQSQLGGEQ